MVIVVLLTDLSYLYSFENIVFFLVFMSLISIYTTFSLICQIV